jgi:hypothetical protein
MTGRFVYAGADGHNYRAEQRRAQKDREFLAKIRTATLDQLLEMWRNHDHKKAPAWKRVALIRAIEREQTAGSR